MRLKHTVEQCQKIPTSTLDALRLIAALEEHRVYSSRTVFRYTCPSCRCYTSVKPAVAYALRDMISKVRKIVGGSFQVEAAKACPINPPFQGLFL
jgi:hypothetical protein